MVDRSLLGLTVLIVSEEPLVAMALDAFLTDQGATCIGSVGSLENALEMISVGGFDLALLEVNLHTLRIDPVADRLDASGIPFIYISGYSEDALPDAHRHRPVIAKPYSDADVLVALLQHRQH